MRAGIGRSAPTPWARPAAGAGGPLPARVWLEVERAELVHAHDHLRVAGQHVGGAVHEPVQVQDAVLLGLEGRVA